MTLSAYFTTDDGSLPEIEVAFDTPEATIRAFFLLFELGARDSTSGGARVWLCKSQSDSPFSGPIDASRVVSGEIEPFHAVLGAITVEGVVLPDLGVLVMPDALTFDYRMGSEWGEHQRRSLLFLLKRFTSMGGSISVPWWGNDAGREFEIAIAST